MNSVTEILFARRPIFKYQAPAICEVNFSTSTFPVIILNPIEPLASPTGLELGGGGTSRFHLSWNRYPGALCYNVYKAVDELDPFGAYSLIAECITDNFIDLDDFGPGCYRITSVTPEGESPFSDPECIDPIPGPPDVTTEPASAITDSAAQLNGTVDPNGSDADVRFEWGLTTGYGNLTPVVDIGVAPTAFSALINGLIAATTYHFRALAAGPGGNAIGDDLQFTTANIIPPPAADIKVVELLDTLHDLAENGAIAGDSVSEAGFWVPGVGTTMVGSFGGGNGGTGWGINDSLDFYGATSVPAAFGTTPIYYNGALVDLGDGLNPGVAYSPNAAGIAPVKWNTGGGSQGKIYDPDTATLTDMGQLFGTVLNTVPGNVGNVVDNYNRKTINSANQVAVTCIDSPFQAYACRWEAGVFTDFSPFSGVKDAYAVSVDEAGNLLLTTQSAGLQRGYVNATDIGGPVDHDIRPQAMSKTGGIVCGWQELGGSFLPFRWDIVGGYTLIDLTAIGAAGAFPEDCNSHGDIVGQDFNGQGFLHRSGVTYNLTNIVTALFPLSGWTSILDASLVNDNRQIAGIGIHNGVATAYLLTLPAGSETP